MYTPVLQPYRHQVEAAEALQGRPSFALFMAQRTGKTKTIIDEWGQAVCQGELDRLLVIAPAGAYRTWEDELHKHLPQDVRGLTQVGVWQSGKKNADIDEIVLPNARPRVLVVNVEALSTIERVRELCAAFLEGGRAMIVIDESTTIKNPSAHRTRAACWLAPKAVRRRILSGLPDPQSPLDYFSQMWFLDPQILGFKNFYAFRARYAVMKKIKVGARSVDIVVGYRNVEDLKAKITPHMFRRTLKDCYDMPAKVYMRRDVELTPAQVKIYRDLKERATSQLSSGEHVTATEVIVQILRLHQVCCGHVRDEDGQVHPVPTNKVKVLLELLEDYDGKAIIWCSYGWDLAQVSLALRQEYGDESVAQFWGGNLKTREDDNRRFQTEPACRWMVATPGAGARGRTWPMANLMVYYSNTDNLEHRDQSEERGSVVGKEEPVTIVDLIARGTVEEVIVKSLRNKINMSTAILGGNWREWIV